MTHGVFVCIILFVSSFLEFNFMNSSRFQSRKSQALGFAAKSVLAILLSCSSLMSFSQEAPLGTLSGTIQDADYGGSVLNIWGGLP